MQITIREIDKNTIQYVRKGGSSFEVTSKLVLHAENGKISYTIVDVPPYTKQYGLEEVDSSTYIGNPDRTIFFAFMDGELAGQIRVLKHWNAYAYIDDIAVDAEYRRRGVGRHLIQRALEWARDKGFPGMMLETQNNNVAACRFYESCGFELGGFDVYLYKGLNRLTDEIALFWYYIFE